MMQKVTDNIYVETEFMGCNTGFVVTNDGVVVVDTPHMPVDAMRWRDEVAKHGPVRYLINTEPHDDHFTGNWFFKGTVISHEGVREAILAASLEQLKEQLKRMSPDSLPLLEGFNYRPPTITFSQRLTLYLGDHTFHLITLPGHTPYEVAVYIPEERVLFTSDNIFHKLQPYLRQAVPYEWLDSLERLQEMDADILIPGHGSVCDRSYIPEMRDSIQVWIDAVSAAIDKGMSLEEAQEKINLLDRYPMGADERREREKQRVNIARLYEVLKK